MNDYLILGFDYSEREDNTVLTVFKRKGDETYVVKQFINKEAVDMYNQLSCSNIEYIGGGENERAE